MLSVKICPKQALAHFKRVVFLLAVSEVAFARKEKKDFSAIALEQAILVERTRYFSNYRLPASQTTRALPTPNSH